MQEQQTKIYTLERKPIQKDVQVDLQRSFEKQKQDKINLKCKSYNHDFEMFK